jgi:chromosomal replication initiation ATPase DnaA
VGWAQIASAVEVAKGENRAEFSVRHGDWGRDAALWLGRRQGRLSLAELGRLVGGMDYSPVGQAVSQFGSRLERDRELRGELGRIGSHLSNVEM